MPKVVSSAGALGNTFYTDVLSFIGDYVNKKAYVGIFVPSITK